MIKINTNLIGPPANHVTCPFCFADLMFPTFPPPHCPKCSEELPPWHDLLENIEDRRDYHFKHPSWDYSTCALT